MNTPLIPMTKVDDNLALDEFNNQFEHCSDLAGNCSRCGKEVEGKEVWYALLDSGEWIFCADCVEFQPSEVDDLKKRIRELTSELERIRK